VAFFSTTCRHNSLVGGFAHLIPIAIVAPLVCLFFVDPGGVRGAEFYISIAVMGVIPAAILSVPYALYVGSGGIKGFLFIFLGLCILPIILGIVLLAMFQ